MIDTLCKMADIIRDKAPDHEKKHLIDCVNSLIQFHHNLYGKQNICGVLKIKLPVPKLPFTHRKNNVNSISK